MVQTNKIRIFLTKLVTLISVFHREQLFSRNTFVYRSNLEKKLKIENNKGMNHSKLSV